MLRRAFALLIICLLTLPLRASAQGGTFEPNDPELRKQWALEKVSAGCAWARTQGSEDVVVAVVDSGVDMGHPDLRDNLLDSGRDFVEGDDDPSDENGHGTNVAGIIAAVTDNDEGIAGMAGNVRILPIRVMDAEGAGTDQDIAAGIRYAADEGAQVINVSLGSMLPVGSDLTVEAIRYANAQGSLVVVAAGNSYLPIPNFSLDLQEDALIVAATDEDDRKTDFSNYGPWVGVSAPGHQIYSTMPTYEVFLTSQALPKEQRFKQDYDYMSGTSQATPMVSGLAALLFSQHADWDATRVRKEIQGTAANIREQNPSAWPFRPEYLGQGRIDACEALGGPISGAPQGESGGAGGLPLPLLLGAMAGILILLAGAVLMLRRRRAPLAPAPHVYQMPPQPMQGPPNYPPRPQVYPDRGAGQGAFPQPPRPDQWQAPPQQQMPPPAPPQRAAPVPPQGPPPAPGATPNRNFPTQSLISPAPPAPQAPWAAPGGTPPSSLVIEKGPGQGRVIPLQINKLLLGRGPENDIQLLEDASVSRQHARITVQGAQLLIEDLGSSHGTFVNGQRVGAPTPMRPGDRLHVGTTTLRYQVEVRQ